jgi:transcriptional regulator with XRE-family HTH domain
MPRRKPDPRTWTPNQIVAFNISKARLKRGWTQDQAAEALAPYLGARLSTASWSAIERSVDGGRIREFTADELIAFARGFELPLGWFLTPPPASDDIRVATPDTKTKGLDGRDLLDVVLGTPDSLAAWEEVLLTWPSMMHRMRVGPDGKMEALGRVDDDVHHRLAEPARLRARILLRDQLGDLDDAKDVLAKLMHVLTDLDDPSGDN